MFFQKKESKPAHAYLPLSSLNFGASQEVSKKSSFADEKERMLVKAKVFVEESRSREFNARKKIIDFSSNNYWFYGYFLGSLTATMMGSLALSSRIPFISRYLAFVSLAGGYFGACGCQSIHMIYLGSHLKKTVQQEIDLAKKLDDETGHVVGDYQEEVRRLEGMLSAFRSRGALAPSGAAGEEVRGDDSAEELAARYALAKNWKFHNAEKGKPQQIK